MPTITSLVAGQTAKITIAFSIGRYGWSESYYHSIPETGLAGLRDLARALCNARLRLCGYGVFIDSFRISDVAVRRDADDNTVNLRATNTSDTSVPLYTFTDVRTAEDSPAINPNIAIVTRIEGANKVYHGQHPLAGCPENKFTSGERLVNRAAWRTDFETWATYLISNAFLFPCLNRTDPGFEDVPVRAIDSTTGALRFTAVPASWAVDDRIRVINARRAGRARGGSIVGNIIGKTATTVTLGFPGGGALDADAGQKTIAHKEESVYVSIVSVFPEYASHRNRGRPLFSPRGRRSRSR